MISSIHRYICPALIFILWLGLVSWSNAETRKNLDEGIIIAQHTPAHFNPSRSYVNQTLSLLKGAAIYGGSMLLQQEAGHNFMGRSLGEVSSTAGSIAGANLVAQGVIDGLDAMTVKISEWTDDHVLVSLIPNGKLLTTAMTFGLSYSAHTGNFNFFLLTKRDSIALYAGSVAFGLSYDQINSAIRRGIQMAAGVSPEASDAWATTTTSLTTGLLIGLLATKARIDIDARKFNTFSVLSTALMVGHTVAYDGKAIHFSVKYLFLKMDMPEQQAEAMAKGVTTATLGTVVVALSQLPKAWKGGYKHYHNKALGDATKTLGFITSTYYLQPYIHQYRDSVHESIDDAVLITDIVKRILHMAADPAMIVGTHFVLTGLMAELNKRVDSQRPFDFGISWLVAAFMGLGQRCDNIVTHFTAADHLTVWTLAAVSALWQNFRGRGKVKTS